MSARGERIAHVLLALTLVAAAGALWPPPFRLTDHHFFWYVGRLYLSGVSPYDAAVWSAAAQRFDNVNISLIVGLGGTIWAYPPWTGYLFVPFGALPAEIGLPALHLAYLTSGVCGGILLARLLGFTRWTTLALALLLVPTFQPFVYAERLGHFASFLLLGAACVLYALRRGRALPLVAGALLLAAKPQVSVLFGLVILVLLVRGRRWRLLVTTAGALLAVAALSTARHPEAVAAMFSGGRERLSLIGPGSINPVPNAWSLGAMVSPDGWLAVGLALVAGAALCISLAVGRAPESERVWFVAAGALVLSLAAVPYVFSYDHLLLVPAALLVVRAAERLDTKRRALHLALSVTVITLLPWLAFLIGVGSGDHSLSGAVPLLFAPLLLVAAGVPRPSRPPAAVVG